MSTAISTERVPYIRVPEGGVIAVGPIILSGEVHFVNTISNLSGVLVGAPDLAQVESSAPVFQPVILFEHNGLKRPIWARVDTSHGRNLLVDLATGIYGAGESPETAVADFMSALREHAEELEQEKLLLNPEMQTQLVYLQMHLA